MSPNQYRLVIECIFSFYASIVPTRTIDAEKIRIGIPAEISIQEIPDSKLNELNAALRALSRDPRGP